MERGSRLEELCENAGFLKEDIEELVKSTQRNLDSLASHEASSRETITTLMKSIREILAQKEREMLSLNASEFSKCKTQLQKRLDESTELAREVGALAVTFEDNYTQNKEENIPQMKQTFESLESKYFSIQDRKICPEFTIQHENQHVLENFNFSCYEFHSKFTTDTESAESENHEEDAPPDYLEIVPTEFICQTNNDIKQPMPTALIWYNRKIIIADKANMRIKFYREDGEFMYDIPTHGSPYGVCYVYTMGTDETYAVTVAKTKKLVFITIPESGEKAPYEQYSVETKIGYSGICSSDRVLIVSAVNIPYPRVDIVNHYGGALRSIAVDVSKQPLFSFPRFIVADGEVCVVSDWKKNLVIFLRHRDCAILGTYGGTESNPLTEPYGVAVDGKGYIFIVDGKTGLIHIVNRNYQLVHVIEETANLFSPRLLAYDPRTERLAVTHSSASVKCIPAPSAVPSYSRTSGGIIPSAPRISDSLLLPPNDDSHLRSPSPGF